MIAEFHPATDSVRDAACRSLWEDFSKKQGSLPEDVRAFMPILYTGFFNREYGWGFRSRTSARGYLAMARRSASGMPSGRFAAWSASTSR
jgi:hypothetical protein